MYKSPDGSPRTALSCNHLHTITVCNSLLRNVHPAPSSKGTAGSFTQANRPGLPANQLEPMLGMSGAMILLPLYAFIAGTQTTLTVLLLLITATLLVLEI